MKKFRVLVALSAVLTLAMSVTAFAATSPKSGVAAASAAPVVAQQPAMAAVSAQGAPVVIKPITDKAVLVTLASNVMVQAQSLGGAPQVMASADIQAPAGYTGGPIAMTLAVPGIVPGDAVYASHLMSNGQVETIQLAAGNGTASGTFNGLSPVTIFKVIGGNAAASAASSGLHQTGSADYTVFFLALAIISGSVMLYANKRYNRA